MCSESYTPVISGNLLHSNLVTPENGLGAGVASVGEPRTPPPPAAKYISPFGNCDDVPVFPDAHGNMLRSEKDRPIVVANSRATTAADSVRADHYFSLPNTPDTEDPTRAANSRGQHYHQKAVIKLTAEVGGESYI